MDAVMDRVRAARDALRAGCAYVAFDFARARVVVERAGVGARVIVRIGQALGVAHCDALTVEALAEAMDAALSIAEVDVTEGDKHGSGFNGDRFCGRAGAERH
jgi:hypothetical protein